MAITKSKVIKQITLLPTTNAINLQWANQLTEDGNVLSETFERTAYEVQNLDGFTSNGVTINVNDFLTAFNVATLDEKVAALAAKATAESALAAEQAKVATLTTEKATLQTSLDTKTTELADKVAELASSQSQVSQLTTEKAGLQNLLDAKTADVTKALADLATAQARITELEAQLAAPPASDEVTMRQARLALLQNGLLDDVVNAIEALPEPQKTAAKIEWDYSNTVKRDHNFTKQMMAMLGMTELQGDELFALAATL